MTKWVWYGKAGHLCVEAWCCYHLCTKVGKYLVSTVGEYYPPHANELLRPKKPTEIGCDRFYETMVFECGDTCTCGCGMPTISGSELDFMAHKDSSSADKVHLKMCVKWSNK